MKKIALFPIYIIARLLKSVLWWTPIAPFSRWFKKPEYLKKDALMICVALTILAPFYLLGLFWGVIALISLIVLATVLFVANNLNGL